MCGRAGRGPTAAFQLSCAGSATWLGSSSFACDQYGHTIELNRGGAGGMTVFFVCAGLLGLLATALTIHVGRLRIRKKIYLGDGGAPEMLSAIRAHANL